MIIKIIYFVEYLFLLNFAKNYNFSANTIKCPPCACKDKCKKCLVEDVFPVPSADDVYDLGFIFNDHLEAIPADFLLHTQIPEIHIPVAPRLNGVFGYNPDDTINLNGGVVYNAELTSIDFKVSGVEPSIYDYQEISDTLPILAKYFSERGFQIPPPDSWAPVANSFSYSTNNEFGNPQLGGSFSLFNINPVFGANPAIPDFVDLIALTTLVGDRLGVAPYNPDVVNRDRRFAYPYRIPVITNEKAFCCKNHGAYYNPRTYQLFIDIHNLDVLIGSAPNQADPPFGPWTNEFKMQGFQGGFQLVKRSTQNLLIPAPFATADALIQITTSVDAQTTYKNDPLVEPAEDSSISFSYLNSSGVFSGLVLKRYNGGSPAYDIQTPDIGAGGGVTNWVDSWITQQDGAYAVGDNPNTPIKERYSIPNKTFIYNSQISFQRVLKFPQSFLANPPIPEDVANFPLPEDGTSKSLTLSFIGHEYVHATQAIGLGTYAFQDAESQAAGIQGDPLLNQGAFYTIQTAQQTQFIVRHARGTFPLLVSDLEIGIATYGANIWWVWLRNHYDPLNQVMRRSSDLVEINVLSQINATLGYYPSVFTLPYSGSNRLAVKQALQELHSLDLSDLYRDYAIALSLLRNNDSIPTQYRIQYPYWTAQSAYPDVTRIAAGALAYQTWWQELDQNTNPSSAATATLGSPQPMFPQLNNAGVLTLNVQDLSSRIYVVNQALNTVTVENVLGEVVATIYRYDSTTPTGVFVVEGPVAIPLGNSHLFNVPKGTGIVRLVVSNVKVTDWGTPYNFFNEPAPPSRITGTFRITSA